jgi:hypothetical protein
MESFRINKDSTDNLFETITTTLRSILTLSNIDTNDIYAIVNSLTFIEYLSETTPDIDVEINISKRYGNKKEYEIYYWYIILKE